MAEPFDENIDLLTSGRPFIAYREPRALRPVVVAGEGLLRFGSVAVSPWPSESVSAVIPEADTPRQEYTAAVGSLIEKLKERGGKTVVQRVVTGTFRRFDIVGLAREFFARPTPTFDFILYDPSTAYWLGRSPELLLETEDYATFHTRALAGTRPLGRSGDEWSAKNIDEHRMVADDICRRIAALGMDVRCSELTTFDCGAVSHLMTPITAVARRPDAGLFGSIVREIHPTPAVGGLPRETAMAEIAALETTPRELYGGYIDVGGRRAYVVLRCAHFDTTRWAVYTGSGITASSDADDEWSETRTKASSLIDFLSQY